MSNRQIEPVCEHQTVALPGTILALDLGTTTGWALRSSDGLISSGVASFRNGRFDGGGMRYLRFTNWLGEWERLSGPIAAIWFEEVRRHTGTNAAHVFGGLMASLTSWSELRGIPYQGAPVGTIKKHATGKGNAKPASLPRTEHPLRALVWPLRGASRFFMGLCSAKVYTPSDDPPVVSCVQHD